MIPVYRAEAFLRRAVESCLDQPEVVEVILVEDHSPDASFALARDLAVTHGERVRVARSHPHRNVGAAAARNVGIRLARAPYVAFLDADDWYLPGRFDPDLRLLKEDPGYCGVYGLAAIRFDDAHARARWDAERLPGEDAERIGVARPLAGKSLLRAWVRGLVAEFHISSVTVCRRALVAVGGFPEDLVISEDSALWLRLMAICRFRPGCLDRPRSIYRRHAANTFRSDNPACLDAAWRMSRSDWLWARRRRLPAPVRALFKARCAGHLALVRGVRPGTGLWWRRIAGRVATSSDEMPEMLFEPRTWAGIASSLMGGARRQAHRDRARPRRRPGARL